MKFVGKIQYDVIFSAGFYILVAKQSITDMDAKSN